MRPLSRPAEDSHMCAGVAERNKKDIECQKNPKVGSIT